MNSYDRQNRYVLEIALDNCRSALVQVIDTGTAKVVSTWRGAEALCLLSQASLPAAYRLPGAHPCDRFLVFHLLCAGSAFATTLRELRELGALCSTRGMTSRIEG